MAPAKASWFLPSFRRLRRDRRATFRDGPLPSAGRRLARLALLALLVAGPPGCGSALREPAPAPARGGAAGQDSAAPGALPAPPETVGGTPPTAPAETVGSAGRAGSAEPRRCPPAPGDSLVHLTVLATNDLHGALEPKTYPWSNGRPVGGAATLAAYIRRARAVNPEGTLLLDGGDLLQGTAISNLVQGASVVDLFNQLGYDAAAIGNHEFDFGIDTLEQRMAQARFPMLSANIVRASDGLRPRWARPTALVRRKGLTIGLIGLTTRSTPATTLPSHVVGLEFTDLADAADSTATRLRREGADLILVVAHAGGFFNADSNVYHGEIVDAMRRMSSSLGLVVSGHSHTLLEGEIHGIPLVQARAHGTALGVVQLWVDPRGSRPPCWDVRVETTWGDSIAPDSAAAALVEAYHRRMGPIGDRIVAQAAERLTGSRGRESALGDLVADAQRAATGTQVALTNSGGIRADLPAGPVRWRDAFEVQPFANPLYKLALEGRTLKLALEQGVTGRYGLVQVSGIRFAVDRRAPAGARVRDLRLESGREVHPDSTYTVTVNNFMFEGGDDYTMLREAKAAENTGILDLDAFLDYLRDLPQPIRYGSRHRIRFLGAAPAAVGAR